MIRPLLLLTLLTTVLAPKYASAQGRISGSLTKWETITIDFAGPSSSESSGRAQPKGGTEETNPFLDYRLILRLQSPTKKIYFVPGFFDGDGNVGDTGDIWRVRFTPDEVGKWDYTASFRGGVNVAIDLDPTAGEPVVSIDGTNGSFEVAPIDESATGHLRTGRLEFVGGYYLKQRDGGYWLKGGTDSPENFLAYKGFDNTQSGGTQKVGKLLEFNAHASDWREGDPDWDTPDYSFAENHDGRRIIGALNFLADRGINSIYCLLMNIGGDGQDTHPYANVSSPNQLAGDEGNDNLHFDLSKFRQWETVFRHAQSRGIHLHLSLGEAEAANKRELDDGQLDVERKLFYREMIARFGHHNSIQWNLCEEYDLGDGFGGSQADEAARILEFADYVARVDPYDHPITVHNAGNSRFESKPEKSSYRFFIGQKNINLTSLQRASEYEGWSDVVEAFRHATKDAERMLPIMVDEPESPARIALGPPSHGNDRVDAARRFILWDVYFSGGAGIEWYIDNRDQSLDNFGELIEADGKPLDLDKLWKQTAIARSFVEKELPFWEMEPADELLRGTDTDYGGGEVFAKPGEIYAIYLPKGSRDDGGSVELDLTQFADQQYRLRWFNPREGKFAEPTSELAGGDWRRLGATPDGVASPNDWVALIKRIAAEQPQ